MRSAARRESVVDGQDFAGSVMEENMERHARLAGAVEGAVRHEVIIEELPPEFGPGRVEHPVNDSRGTGLVGDEGFEHGPDALVIHELGFPFVIGQVLRSAEPPGHGFVEAVEIVEFSPG